MKILQLTRGVDNNTFMPIACITLEVSPETIQDNATLLPREQFERWVGQQFLNALKLHIDEQNTVTDVEPKEEKNDNSESAAVPQES